MDSIFDDSPVSESVLQPVESDLLEEQVNRSSTPLEEDPLEEDSLEVEDVVFETGSLVEEDKSGIANPHILGFIENGFSPVLETEYSPFFFLSDSFGSTVGRELTRVRDVRDVREAKSSVCWPERGELLLKINFILETKAKEIIHVGNISLYEINVLSSLFPETTFRFFCEKGILVNKYPNNVSIYECRFDLKLAYHYRGRVLISNYNTKSEGMSKEDLLKTKEEDMETQLYLYLLMRPPSALLRFAPTKDQNYLVGKIHYPLWSDGKSLESRLYVSKIEKCDYKYEEYVQKLEHFYSNSRFNLYSHNVVATGIDHCFDCFSEIVILNRYVTATGKIPFKLPEIPALSFQSTSRDSTYVERQNENTIVAFSENSFTIAQLSNFLSVKYNSKCSLENFSSNKLTKRSTPNRSVKKPVLRGQLSSFKQSLTPNLAWVRKK